MAIFIKDTDNNRETPLLVNTLKENLSIEETDNSQLIETGSYSAIEFASLLFDSLFNTESHPTTSVSDGDNIYIIATNYNGYIGDVQTNPVIKIFKDGENALNATIYKTSDNGNGLRSLPSSPPGYLPFIFDGDLWVIGHVCTDVDWESEAILSGKSRAYYFAENVGYWSSVSLSDISYRINNYSAVTADPTGRRYFYVISPYNLGAGCFLRSNGFTINAIGTNDYADFDYFYKLFFHNDQLYVLGHDRHDDANIIKLCLVDLNTGDLTLYDTLELLSTSKDSTNKTNFNIFIVNGDIHIIQRYAASSNPYTYSAHYIYDWYDLKIQNDDIYHVFSGSSYKYYLLPKRFGVQFLNNNSNGCSFYFFGGSYNINKSGSESSYTHKPVIEIFNTDFESIPSDSSWNNYGGSNNIELAYNFSKGSAVHYLASNDNREHVLLFGSGTSADPNGNNLDKVNILGYDEYYETEEYGRWMYEQRANLDDTSYNQLFCVLGNLVYQIQANKKVSCINVRRYEAYSERVAWSIFGNDSICPLSDLEGSLVITYNNRIHILGGFESPRAHYSFDGESSTSMYTLWNTETAIPYDFKNGAATVADGKLFIFGGYRTTRNMAVFDGTSWTLYENVLPFEMDGGYAEFLDGRIHLFGGLSVDHYSLDIKKWNNPSGNWVQETSLPYSSWNGCSSVFKNQIYIFGGIDPYGGDYSLIHSRDTILLNVNAFSHIFNRIKRIWTKVKIPTYDQYGNCVVSDQIKKVKGVWIGDSNNRARRI